MALEILGELEKNLGGRVCLVANAFNLQLYFQLTDHFDLIAGVSTGAIISVLLGAHRMKVAEAKEIYMELSRQLFKQGKISGVSGLLLSHAYYNTKVGKHEYSNIVPMVIKFLQAGLDANFKLVYKNMMCMETISKCLYSQILIQKWVEIIKNVSDCLILSFYFFSLQVIGESISMMDTVRNENSVRLAIVSSIVNALQLQPYVFRQTNVLDILTIVKFQKLRIWCRPRQSFSRWNQTQSLASNSSKCSCSRIL